MLEYVAGRRQKFEFTKKNQLDFIRLCDLFQLAEVKQTLMSYLQQNFDDKNVFEYLSIAAGDPSNKEALRESYWIIVYIYLRKIAWDVSESFLNEKTKQMLKSVNPFDFSFTSEFLVHEKTQRKINLNAFVATALEEAELKNKHLALNNMHNLTKVGRTKSEMGLLSDYPHFYQMTVEGKQEVKLYAVRNTENGEFIVSS